MNGCIFGANLNPLEHFTLRVKLVTKLRLVIIRNVENDATALYVSCYSFKHT